MATSSTNDEMFRSPTAPAKYYDKFDSPLSTKREKVFAYFNTFFSSLSPSNSSSYCRCGRTVVGNRTPRLRGRLEQLRHWVAFIRDASLFRRRTKSHFEGFQMTTVGLESLLFSPVFTSLLAGLPDNFYILFTIHFSVIIHSPIYNPNLGTPYFEQCYTIERKLGQGSFGEVNRCLSDLLLGIIHLLLPHTTRNVSGVGIKCWKFFNPSATNLGRF